MSPKQSESISEAVHIQLAELMEAAGDVVFRLNEKAEILYAGNRAVALMSSTKSIINLPLLELVVTVDRIALNNALKQVVALDKPIRIHLRMSTHPAEMWFELQLSTYLNDQGKQEMLVVGRDISAQRITEERLRHMATHDSLTGLPNRTLLSDRISMAIAQARRTSLGFSILTLDLDGFKKVNDALGHPVGDVLLQVVGGRLRDTLRDIDTLARVGGDEFVAVLPGVVVEVEMQLIARRLIAALQLPLLIQEHTLYISTSIGGAIYPTHGDSEVRLLAHADTAMARAKETGKSRCVVYSPEKFTLPEHDVLMEAAMFDAVRNGEFSLQYQPIVDASSRKIMGFEALMRWSRPGLGVVSPVQFIPMAEGNGLISLLGAWALKVACVQLKRFEEAAGRSLYVSVNVSPRQFRNDQFLEMVDDAIALSGLQGDQLLLEITEGVLMSDPEHAEALLTSISERKVRIAIDDFGTGYSSLAYLKRFPIAALKIDRAFIKDLPASVKDAAICNVVLNLADNLNLATVAEGVENEQQLEFLAKQGCNLIQGYHTGRPLLPLDAIALLKAGAALPTVLSVPTNS